MMIAAVAISKNTNVVEVVLQLTPPVSPASSAALIIGCSSPVSWPVSWPVSIPVSTLSSLLDEYTVELLSTSDKSCALT